MDLEEVVQKLLRLRCKRNQMVIYYPPCSAYLGAPGWQLRLAMPSYAA
jgi:hypothetical protein